MSRPDVSRSEISSQWNNFVNSGTLEYTGLDLSIANSWQRSRQAGVDPYQLIDSVKPQKNINSELPAELESAAYPVLEEVYDSVRGSGFQLYLVDNRGYVVHTIPGSQSFNINWQEMSIGTNAIGIAITTGQAIQVAGKEHYCCELHKLTTTAVPVFDQNRSLLLVLGLIGPYSEDHSHVLTMLVKAAEKITNRFKILRQNYELKLYNHRLTSIINNMSDGVIIFSDNGAIELANPALELILGIPSDKIKEKTLPDLFAGKAAFIQEFFHKGGSFSDVEVFLNGAQDKIRCLASGHLSRNENGEIDNGMILFQNMDRIHRLVNRFSGSEPRFHFKDIIGRSQALQDSINIAQMAAKNSSNVLLQGESGTGKEIFAQAIHNASSRCHGPFVAINCGAIPRELVSSELFGYVDGAFTGAKRGGRIGKFEMASGGTIFLDEIGDMPFDLQVALLRVLQNKYITRIGDSKEIPVDVRVICATNKNLRYEIERENFREDLYYRLNVISVTIPPLRDRKEDIPLLVDYCLKKFNKNNDNLNSVLEPGIMDYLLNYSWPGNVRELQNIVERLVCISGQRPISSRDLPSEIIYPADNFNTEASGHSSPTPPVKLGYKQRRKQLLAQEESRQIIELLQNHRGNVTQVAREMGLSRMTLYRKMKLYNITRK
jgi:transcriptional regulator with PAS, ATPase and Fis domain